MSRIMRAVKMRVKLPLVQRKGTGPRKSLGMWGRERLGMIIVGR
jgi:hypothetical protein